MTVKQALLISKAKSQLKAIGELDDDTRKELIIEGKKMLDKTPQTIKEYNIATKLLALTCPRIF